MMRYRTLGSTGLLVSMLGFGASPLGNVFSQVPLERDQETVGEAVDAGVTLFDVSPYYGLGLAEQRLGSALRPMRNQVVLATKVGRYGVDTFDFTALNITRAFEESLRRLQTDYVDLLQAHDIEFGNVDQILTETLPALVELKRQGKTRFIGITSYWPGLLARVASQFPVDTILNYCHANLFIDDMDQVLSPFARQAGIGLMNASPLHMGLLGGGRVPSWHPAPRVVRAAAEDINRLCWQHGIDPAIVALHLCLQHPVAASTFIGMSSVDQVRTNCTALDWQPDEDLIVAIHARVQPVFNMVWPQGRPENEDPTMSRWRPSDRNAS